MLSTDQYLDQLTKDKDALVNNLNTKGISADPEETFTSLVPKVLDVQGKYQEKVSKAKEDGPVEVLPDASYDAISKVTIPQITSSDIDNLEPQNIKKGEMILGVTGIYAGEDIVLQEKIAIPTTSEQIVMPDESYTGLSKVTISPIETEEITIEPSLSQQIIDRDGQLPLGKVTVNNVTSEIDPNIQPENIKINTSILGVVGTYTGGQQEVFGPISNGTNTIPGILKAIQNLPDGLTISGTNADYAFANATGLLAAPSINFSNVASMKYGFSGCISLTDVTNLVNLNNIKSLSHCFDGCTKLTDITPLSNLNGLNDLSYTYKGCTLLENVPNLTINSTDEVNMSYTFNKCTKLSNINKISNPSGTLKLFHTFDGCTLLKNINNFSLECTSASLDYAYANCSNLTDISQLQNVMDTNNITSLSHCFYNDEKILLPQTLKIESPNASYMFGNESTFERNPRPSVFEPMLQGDTFIDLTNVEDVSYFIKKRNLGSGKLTVKISNKTTNMSNFITHYMAEGDVSLEITSDEVCTPNMNNFVWTGSSSYTYLFNNILIDEKIKPTDLSYAFKSNSYDTSSVPMGSGYQSISVNLDECLNLSSAFYGCPHLVEINFTGESRKCTKFTSMLQGYVDNKLQSLTTIRNLYFDSAIVVQKVFGTSDCALNLTTIENIHNIGKAYTLKTQHHPYYSIDVRHQTKLTHQSIMNIINGLYDLNLTYNVAGGGTLYTQQLLLGETNLAKLTPEEILVATNKGWTVS